MKKSGKPPVMPQDKAPAVGPPAKGTVQPLEKVKNDGTNNTPVARKNSAGDKVGEKTPTAASASNGKPLSKSLSKSHDNLASTLRKKAVAATLAGNKENVSAKDRAFSPAPKFKTPRTPNTPIRKSQSAPDIDDTDSPMKRAQSAQNISRAQSAQSASKASAVKRASSTQNVSNKGGTRQVRISAPANAMAYNAELLASFEKDKKLQERRISELIQLAETRKTETERLKYEVRNLKESGSHEEVERLRNDNRLLKDKLSELGVSVEHCTDSEKLSLLHRPNEARGASGGTDAASVKYTGAHRDFGIDHMTDVMYSTAGSEPALSIGEVSCITPEHPSSISLDNSNWDKHSHKSCDSLSEVSVACLQDRILQMEETHYSTNEELQATLQELGDLQDAVNDLASDNERLADEKMVLLESLCAQTEKLENSRMQIGHMKALLVGDSEGADRSENERQLVALVKGAQEEKDEFMLKQSELFNTLTMAENDIRELQDVISALRDKVQIYEMKNESLLADKRALEAQVSEFRGDTAKDHIDIQRLKSLLENEKQKVMELEQERNATEKSDLEELLDNTRLEKEKLEEKLTDREEKLAVSDNEVLQLREQVLSLEEEVKVSKNNAKMQVGDLEYQLQQKDEEKAEYQQEMEGLRDHIDQLQVDCDRYLEEKKTLKGKVGHLEGELKLQCLSASELDSELKEMRQKYRDEQDEWRQFQSDLQTAVVIANNFKAEAQDDMERIVAENQFLKDQVETLQVDVERTQGELDNLKQAQQEKEIARSDLRGKVISTVDRELAVIRQGRKISDPWAGNPSLSVKHLIHSIEEQVKGGGCGTSPPTSPSLVSQESSRRNSADSTMSIGSVNMESPPKRALDRRTSVPIETQFKTPLRHSAESSSKDSRSPLGHRNTISNIILEHSPVTDDTKKVVSPTSSKASTEPDPKKSLTGILTNKSAKRKSSMSETDAKPCEKSFVSPGVQGLRGDPLAILAKQMGGSKRNALLKWCQNKTASYMGIDITNFSSSWNDGLAFCAILHQYLPDRIPYRELNAQDKLRNFTLAFRAAESMGIPSYLNVNEMTALERPDWQAVMTYVTSIYKHFEVDSKL